MAVEAKRGCGYRKIGGTYLVGKLNGSPCDRLPMLLEVCPTCSHGIKPARGFTWVDANALIQGPHKIRLTDLNVVDDAHEYLPNEQPCDCWKGCCVFCKHPEQIGRAGLLWVSDKFYPTPAEFLAEGKALGLSRRIARIPRGFKVGETWVLLGHRKAVRKINLVITINPSPTWPMFDELAEEKYMPGLFYVWRPERIERILPESKRGTEEVKALEKRGITPVFLPDHDVDHGGDELDDPKLWEGIGEQEEVIL